MANFWESLLKITNDEGFKTGMKAFNEVTKDGLLNKLDDPVTYEIKQYKKQTELARQELNKIRDQQATEKRRINEKQIRSLRNNYRPRSLFAAANNEEGMSDQLGG